MARIVEGRRASHPVHITGSDSDSAISISELAGADGITLDAFGRMRVSNPVGIFSSQLNYGKNVMAWQEKTAGSGLSTYSHNRASCILSVAGNGDSVIRQTRAYFRYQPGKSQLIFITGVLGSADTAVTKRVGYFDANNGLFFELTEDGLFVVRRTSTTGSPYDNRVAQTDWNVDKMDGNGPSGITLDTTKTQIFVISFQWLGVGRAIMGLDIDGMLYPVHEFLNANNLDVVYMRSANLPIRWEISGGVGSGASTTETICASVSSEGGTEEEYGTPFSAGNQVTVRNVGTGAKLPLVSIRPKALFKTFTNRGIILPEALSIFSEDATIYWELIYGGTLTNPVWADVSTDYSQTEVDVAATAITGGTRVMSGYTTAGGVGQGAFSNATSRALTTRLPLTLDIDGNHPTTPLTDVFSLVAIARTAASDSAGMLHWRELRC